MITKRRYFKTVCIRCNKLYVRHSKFSAICKKCNRQKPHLRRHVKTSVNDN